MRTQTQTEGQREAEKASKEIHVVGSWDGAWLIDLLL